MGFNLTVLRTHLSTNGIEHELRRLLSNLSESAKYIKVEIAKSNRKQAGSINQFGEEQKALDVIADDIILNRLSYETTFGVRELASEEQDKIIRVHQKDGCRYSVTVDPLDGSSLLGVNLSVGSIFGIHNSPLLSGCNGRQSLVAAMYILYGPETTLVYSAGKGVHEFFLDQAGNWVLSRENMVLNESGQIYATGGNRKDWTDQHEAFIMSLEQKGYKLRYSGALVADFNQILLKGGGIFSYPGLNGKKEGKLRLLMELQPLAKIVEEAGGMASDGKDSILDKIPTKLDERSPIYLGSKCEVEAAVYELTPNLL